MVFGNIRLLKKLLCSVSLAGLVVWMIYPRCPRKVCLIRLVSSITPPVMFCRMISRYHGRYALAHHRTQICPEITAFTILRTAPYALRSQAITMFLVLGFATMKTWSTFYSFNLLVGINLISAPLFLRWRKIQVTLFVVYKAKIFNSTMSRSANFRIIRISI